MKKVIALFFLCFLLVGCSGGISKVEAPSEPNQNNHITHEDGTVDEQDKQSPPTEQGAVDNQENKEDVNKGSESGMTYTVQRGDTLYSIANKFGVLVEELCVWNDLDRQDYIFVGQVLNISGPQLNEDYPIDSNEKNSKPEGKFVYLTFDDGPSRNTHKILDILNEYEIKGTFFVVGSAIRNTNDSEALLNRMIDEGHYIGLHSMTHDKALLYAGDNAAQNFLDEMLELQAIVKEKTAGFESQLCRAPFGMYNNFSQAHVDIMINSDLNCWDWNVDTNDWRVSSVEEIIEHIEFSLRMARDPNHLVVLFHEHDITLEALPVVIEYFLERGFEFLPYDPDNHFPINLLHNPYL